MTDPKPLHPVYRWIVLGVMSLICFAQYYIYDSVTPLKARMTEVTDAAIERQRINVRWVARLRWAAVAGQIAALATAYWVLGVPLPMGALLTLIGILLVVAALAVLAVIWLTR